MGVDEVQMGRALPLPLPLPVLTFFCAVFPSSVAFLFRNEGALEADAAPASNSARMASCLRFYDLRERGLALKAYSLLRGFLSQICCFMVSNTRHTPRDRSSRVAGGELIQILARSTITWTFPVGITGHLRWLLMCVTATENWRRRCRVNESSAHAQEIGYERGPDPPFSG